MKPKWVVLTLKGWIYTKREVKNKRWIISSFRVLANSILINSFLNSKWHVSQNLKKVLKWHIINYVFMSLEIRVHVRACWCYPRIKDIGRVLNKYNFQLAYSLPRYETHGSTRRLANPHWGHSHCPHNFWSSWEYLIHFQVKILMLIKLPYMSRRLSYDDYRV